MEVSQVVLGYVTVLAWPTVAIIALIILGPGGVLIRFADSLAKSVSDFTRALPELKSTSLTLRSEVDALAQGSADMAREFRETEGRIEALTVRVSDLMDDVKELLAETDRVRLAEGQLRLQQAVAAEGQVDLPEDAVARDEVNDTEAMFREMRSLWTELSQSLRHRLGNPAYFDGRQIAEMAKRLTGDEWVHPLTERDVELIRNLQAEHKRYVRMQSTKESWLSQPLYLTFRRGVEEAIRAIERA